MKFKSLSVLDFMEEYQNWSKTEFLPNVKHHLQELQTIETSHMDSLLFGCRHEIQHLIEFLQGVLEYNSLKFIGVDVRYAVKGELSLRGWLKYADSY